MVRQAESYSWSGPVADSSSLPHPHGTHRRYGTSNAPTTVGVSTTLSTCMYGGEYRLINNMQSGSQYSFETCGGTFLDWRVYICSALPAPATQWQA